MTLPPPTFSNPRLSNCVPGAWGPEERRRLWAMEAEEWALVVAEEELARQLAARDADLRRHRAAQSAARRCAAPPPPVHPPSGPGFFFKVGRTRPPPGLFGTEAGFFRLFFFG